MGALLEEVKTVKTEKEVELFLLQHGEQMVDCLGAEVDTVLVLCCLWVVSDYVVLQVDRIEKNLKEIHPEVRHVDLEVL